MADLKLAKLPDRTPVKLTLHITPDLNRALSDYAEAYAQAYGQESSPAELAPAMLEAFLSSDRAFARMRSAAAPKGDGS